MEKDAKVFVASHEGMIGSAILRRLEGGGFSRVIAGSPAGLDLTDQGMVGGLSEL